MKLAVISILGLVSAIARAQPATPAATPTKIVVKAARMFDGRGDRLRTDAAVLIEGDTIRAVGTAVQMLAKAPGARVIDLGNATLVPGLVDAHTHVLANGTDFATQLTKQSLTARAIAATAHARTMLGNGFTTLRDLESEGAMFADADLADAIERGIVVGPRLYVSTRGLAPTGGYLPRDTAWDAHIATGAQLVDGPDEIRRAIRDQVQYGASWIKVYADFATYDTGRADRPLRSRPNFTFEELRVVVDEAHRLGRKVAAHATGWDGIDAALRAGVDSIEHGAGLTDDLAARMVKQGVALVPTISAFQHRARTAPQSRIAKVIPTHKNAVRRAITKGVQIVNGSDVGSFAFTENAISELVYLVDYGMTPAQALRAATSVAGALLAPLCAPDAKSCERDRIGVIAPNAFADLIAVDGNPLENIKVLAKPRFVMKAGAVFVGP